MTPKFLTSDKIFITGGTGFFGRSLLRFFMQNYPSEVELPQVYVLSRNPHKFLTEYKEFMDLSWLSLVEGNVLDQSYGVGDIDFDYIIHAAADSVVDVNTSDIHRFEQIVLGTKNLLTFAETKQLKNFLYVSSGAVYGNQVPCNGVSENSSLDIPSIHTASGYALGKISAEGLCALHMREANLPITIVRPFAFSGEDLPLEAHFAIGNFVKSAIDGRDIEIKGHPQTIRSYLDQYDLSFWLLKSLVSREPEVFNIGSSRSVEISELAEIVRTTLNPKINIIFSESSKSAVKSVYFPNVEKIKTILGVSEKVKLEDSIKKMAAFYKSCRR